LRLLDKDQEIVQTSVGIDELLQECSDTSRTFEIYKQANIRNPAGSIIGDCIVGFSGFHCQQVHPKRAIPEPKPLEQKQETPIPPPVEVRKNEKPLEFDIRDLKPKEVPPLKFSQPEKPKKITKYRSRFTWSALQQSSIKRKKLYLMEIRKTYQIGNIPNRVSAQDIYDLSETIRFVKLYEEGANTSTAIMEVSSVEEISDIIRSLQSLCGPRIDLRQAKHPVANILQNELDLLNKEHDKTVWELKKQLADANQQIAELTARVNSGALSNQKGLPSVPVDPARSEQMVLQVVQKISSLIQLKAREEDQATLGVLLLLDRWKGIGNNYLRDQQNEALLRSLLEEERKERELALQNKTYDCPICYTDFPIDEMYVLDECYHRYCSECLRNYILTNMGDGKVSVITCPHPECKVLLHLTEVRHLIPADQFERFERFILQQALESMPDVSWCPKAGCTNAMIGDPNRPMMVCSNTSCNFSYCFNCKEEWHADSTCEQYQQWKIENREADARYEEWVRANAKRCPKCKSPIEKNGGCNHMTCKKCSHEFCWLCMEDYKSGHFSNGKCQQFT